MKPRLIVLLALVAFTAALIGAFVGRQLFPGPPVAGVELHEVLHRKLDLDDAQRAHLEILEQSFAVRRKALELELRADNARLAAAIELEHGNGPQVEAAVDQSHRAMGQLQKETLGHIFAMRQILRPDQAKTFDRAVVHALTDDTR
ncbi:Heavy-metal resistance [compost metagenome]|uniref:periplasmic heavy metal sensor n=1 Tax=Sphingomonas sp. PL20 TaxID=2760712 RepID=UPI001AE82067